MTGDGLVVTLLRFPFLYGRGGGVKLRALARVMARLRFFPVPRRIPQRSFLHLENASAVIDDS